MSQGNAAAVRRRVKNIEPPRPASTNDLKTSSTQHPSYTSSNLSISEAFKLVNERLVNLEKGIGSQIEPQYSSTLSEDIISEYEERFKVIAQEIGELKDVVYKLQTFTMDVNKALYDERVKILGDSKLLNKLPISASNLYSKNLLNFVINLYDKKNNKININLEDEIIKKTLVK